MKKEYINLYRYGISKDSDDFYCKEIQAITTNYGYKTKGGVKIKSDELDKIFMKRYKDLIVYSLNKDLDKKFYDKLVLNLDAKKTLKLPKRSKYYLGKLIKENKKLKDKNNDHGLLGMGYNNEFRRVYNIEKRNENNGRQYDIDTVNEAINNLYDVFNKVSNWNVNTNSIINKMDEEENVRSVM